MVVAALVAAVAITATITGMILARGGPSEVAEPAPVAAQNTPGPSTTSQPAGRAVSSAEPGQVVPTAPDPAGQLRTVAASDSPAVESLVGSWVPQLSSKRPSLVAEGKTYDDAAILSEHQALRSAHPKARLLYSGDFANYRGRDFWITIYGEPMISAAVANAWCDAQNLDGDHCYAVRLTHSGGPAGNSVMRPGR